MNSLNLRISSKNTTKSLKIDTPEDIDFILDKYGDFKEIKNLQKAKTKEEQINILRETMKDIKNNCINNEQLIDLYLNILIEVKVKSPLKIPVLRLLMSVSDKDMVETKFHEMIKSKVLDSYSPLIISEFVSTLTFLLDMGQKPISVSGIKGTILNYLMETIQMCLNEFSKSIPPTEILTVIHCIHSCTRCAINLFQKTDIIYDINIYNLFMSVLKHDQIPLDTKANSGILCIMISNHLQFEWFQLEKEINSDDLAQICLIYGVFNTLNFNELNTEAQVNEMKSKFTDFVNLIIAIEERNSAVCNLVLASSRCMLSASRCILTYPDLIKSDNLLSTFLSYVWIHFEHNMDVVRHQSYSILINLVSVGEKSKNKSVFDAILKDISNMHVEKRSNNALLAVIGSIPVGDILQNSPGLVESLLKSIKSGLHTNHASSTYESLMVQHLKEKAVIDEWFNIWIYPVLNIISHNKFGTAKRILTMAIKIHLDVFEYIMKYTASSNWKHHEHLKIIVLEIGRKCGYLNGKLNTKTLWKDVLPYETILSCIKGHDEERVSCFALLTETQKSTEGFEAEDLSLVKSFLKYDINCQTTSSNSYGIFTKFITRFKGSYSSSYRNYLKSPNEKNKKTLNLYEEFKNWIVGFFLCNLFPGANFLRRGAALRCLTFCDKNELWDACILEECHINYLINSIFDSYEDHKELAKNLLLGIPPHMLNLDDDECVLNFLSIANKLASSIRPPESVSAAYLISFLMSVPGVGIILRRKFKILEIPHDLVLEEQFICIKMLLCKLKEELNVAKKSLLKASCSGPMYGLIFVIRHILQLIKFEVIKSDENWKILINDLIKTSFECNKAVAFVVNNSSPEGLLPMDFEYDVSKFAGEESMPNVTSQMVLLCCWRTVKEVSLLLGELSQNAPVSSDESGLISEDQLLSIGDHLIGLLSETKHRGAFEQAYVGFCKLASRLWSYPKGDLHKLPSQWLEDTIIEISNNADLSATRRSAGIPFIVQGLVCTEVGGGKCFHKGIQKLLKLAKDDENTVETRAHALNILRALFRHSDLGEMVSPYIHEGLAIAINGFNSKTWAERNSSTLLLSALITRIFGVPRTSDTDNLSWKNKMTGRIFFMKYPSLFDILYKHLESATNSTDIYPAIYPVLLILGRLYPSSLEGTDSNLQLNKYIPFVSKCASSPILKTRSLAASAIVALISPNVFVKHIDQCFENILNCKNQNLCHGLLLQVLKLLRNGPEECIKMIETRVNVWMCVILIILETEKNCFIVKECCLKIICIFATKFFPFISRDNWTKLSGFLEQTLFCPDTMIFEQPDFGSSKYFTLCAITLITLYYESESVDILLEKLTNLMFHQDYLVLQTCLQFVTCILENDDVLVYNDINDIDPLKLKKTWDTKLKNNIISCETLAKTLTDLLNTKIHHEDKLAILKTIKSLPLALKIINIDYLANICTTMSESIGSVAFECLSSILRIEDNLLKLSNEDFDKICFIIDKYSSKDAEYESRMSVKSLFEDKFNDLVLKSKMKNVCIILTTELRILTDDEPKIRSKNNTNQMILIEDFFTNLPNLLDDKISRICLLITWALGNCAFEDDYDERVFDKGDINKEYAEEILINCLSCQQLHKEFQEDKTLADYEIPSYLIEWIKLESSLEGEYKNIKEIVDCFEKNIKSISSETEPPFASMERKVYPLKHKLNNIKKTFDISYEDLISKFKQI